MLRYKTETRPGLVALYDIRPGNGAGQFLQPRSRSPHGAPNSKGHPFSRGVKYTRMRRNGDFRLKSSFISETLRNRLMVAI